MGDKTNNSEVLLRLYRLLVSSKQYITSIYIYALFGGILSLSIPLGIQAIIGFITSGQLSASWIVLVFLVVLGIILSGIMQVMQLTVTENLQQKIFAHASFEYAYRLPRLNLKYLVGKHVPEIANRFFETAAIQKGISKLLIDFSSASLQIIFGLILLSFYHPFFIVFSVLLIVSIYLILRFTTSAGIQTSLGESKYKYYIAYWLEEVARTMGVYKVNQTAGLPLAKTDDFLKEYLSYRKKHFKILKFQFYNMVAFKAAIAAGILLLGGYLVMERQMNVGQFVASEIIILMVLSSVEKMILSLSTVYDVLTALEKYGQVTDLPLDDTKVNDGYKGEGESGIALKIENLNFTFPDGKQLLTEFSLEIEKGQRYSIVGENASGKSFLLQCLAGMRSDYQGSILFNNVAMQNWNKDELRQRVALSQETSQLFFGSIYENISLGRKNIGIEEVITVAKLVGLNDEIQHLKDGFDCILEPEGKNVSSKARVLIMLCRALVTNPDFLLVEDYSHQLSGEENEELFHRIVRVYPKMGWMAVVKHVFTTKLFDKEIVMSKGKIVTQNSK
ncbi:MAG: peptidase domain-containing ABC transporter [Flavobacteriales bacterium]